MMIRERRGQRRWTIQLIRTTYASALGRGQQKVVGKFSAFDDTLPTAVSAALTPQEREQVEAWLAERRRRRAALLVDNAAVNLVRSAGDLVLAASSPGELSRIRAAMEHARLVYAVQHLLQSVYGAEIRIVVRAKAAQAGYGTVASLG
ncbi:hypothetical protein [Azospirillum tabaci]|uniref:hypothetical protein n=1 Tax=Azospirillum tabaci TaxID=2752310 RepID=UPI001660EB9A|nr:hypothetical protein [Azospirillum tabaci]